MERERINNICGKVVFPKVPLNQMTLSENFHTDNTNIESPFHYFRNFFDSEMVCLISYNSNIYNTQCNLDKGSIRTSETELEQ